MKSPSLKDYYQRYGKNLYRHYYDAAMKEYEKSLTPSYVAKLSDKQLTIETAKPLKHGSPKSLQIITDVTCDKLSELKKGKLLGKGTEGDVYCYLNECEYVIKIQNYKGPSLSDDPEYIDSYDALLQEKQKTNKAHKLGLAPKIHKVLLCEKEGVIITIMDRAQGDTFYDWSLAHYVSKREVNKLFRTVDILHKNGIYHGDLNPRNIMYDGKNFTFIDFNVRQPGYKPVYDYGTLMYYLPSFEHSFTIQKAAIENVTKEFEKFSKDKKIVNSLYLLKNKPEDIDHKTFVLFLGEIAVEDFFYPFMYSS